MISTDGSRVFWTDLATGVLYVREDASKTVRVSQSEPARYWTATPDGQYVFYSEGERLWRYDVETKARKALTVEEAGIQGVIGASEDGEQVYFVAGGQLAPGAVEGQPNLYERDGEETTLIATLDPDDNHNQLLQIEEGFTGDWEGGLGDRTAEVTPDGSAVVFMTKAPLESANFPAGYDNEGCKVGAQPVDCEEVYVYDGAHGGLFCASCDPQGAPPSSSHDAESQIASFLPVSWSATHMMRWVSDSGGRVFFDSFEPLVGQDTNGTLDVYEWERDGEGSCRQPLGCVYLLSGGEGTQTNASYLADASETGDDVFIVSRTKLLAEDENENLHLYDARVGALQLPAADECAGTGCQGVPAAPPFFATPPTETFTGPGNPPKQPPPPPTPLTPAQKLAKALKVCKKDKSKRKRAVCETHARKTYTAEVKAKKTAKARKPA